jgi:hypothetical protein
MLAISTMRHDSLKGLSLRRICRIGPARYGLELPKREFSYRGVLCASEASRDRSGGGLRASGRGRATKLPLQPDLYQLVTDRDRAKAAPDGWENQRGLREDAGQVRGGRRTLSRSWGHYTRNGGYSASVERITKVSFFTWSGARKGQSPGGPNLVGRSILITPLCAPLPQ